MSIRPLYRQLQCRTSQLEVRITEWMARHALTLNRWSLGLVFLWFGCLKLFPGLSPAEGLAGETIHILTAGMVPPSWSIPLLGIWETAIGIGLLTGVALRVTLMLLFAQMVGTLTPIVLLPNEVFVRFPLALTFEGQYIAKNGVLVSAGVIVGATLHGRAKARECRRQVRPRGSSAVQNRPPSFVLTESRSGRALSTAL